MVKVAVVLEIDRGMAAFAVGLALCVGEGPAVHIGMAALTRLRRSSALDVAKAAAVGIGTRKGSVAAFALGNGMLALQRKARVARMIELGDHRKVMCGVARLAVLGATRSKHAAVRITVATGAGGHCVAELACALPRGRIRRNLVTRFTAGGRVGAVEHEARLCMIYQVKSMRLEGMAIMTG